MGSTVPDVSNRLEDPWKKSRIFHSGAGRGSINFHTTKNDFPPEVHDEKREWQEKKPFGGRTVAGDSEEFAAERKGISLLPGEKKKWKQSTREVEEDEGRLRLCI
ncbi:hypothetical protein RUM43_005632 [Polyplax serrata]|uniref:Uncharacterized protein n=1 Tax=Polyplax serrata TaxID=468196 RepID=A0AAN8PJQ7_POLSC